MTQKCRQCEKQFEISEDDLKFYKSISLKIGGKTIEMPPPTLCFICRHQKRLAFRNEINLYHRKCDHSGKQIISMYSPDKPYKIYNQQAWWSDDWDPLDYGRDFDFNKPFFEQFKELQLQVPRQSLNNMDPQNSDYCNLAANDKNCYLAFTADDDEDCCYIRFADWNYRCMDCDYTYNSTDCYESIDLEKCNNVAYSQRCINSSDLYACYNMIGCHDCIGSANLRNKQYYIFNQSCRNAEDYRKKKEELGLNTYAGWQSFMRKYKEFLAKQPRRYLELVNCENSVGDYLLACKNAQFCYNGFELEDCKYMINCYKAKNCYDWDFVASVGSMNCHEMSSCAENIVDCHFCAGCWTNNNQIYYCELSLNSKNLFGCIGLRHKQYCILNKQYSQKEYEELLPKIVEHMRKTGEWGEFFPMELSTYAYNESVAYEFFPLTKEQVLANGWRWIDDESEKMHRGPDYQIPENIKDVPEEICKQILNCEETGKPYKIIPQELSFCKMKGYPVSRVAPRQRHKKRLALRNPWQLWARKCDKCAVDIKTTYSPKRPEPVYCEKCYQTILD